MKKHVITIYKAKDGWRWRWRAGNGRIIAEGGEGYSGKRKAVRAVGLLLMTAFMKKVRVEFPGMRLK
jgi:uncharacterized protein YegP (UPF0339 family)